MLPMRLLPLFSALLLAWFAVDEPEVVVQIKPGTDAGQVEVSVSMPADLAKTLPDGKWSQEQGEQWLRVYLKNDGKDGPAMLGKYALQGKVLSFQPRFALEPGALYGVKFTPPKGKVVTSEYRVPELVAGPPALIEKIYPTANVLPANHLKFYIYFSRPMRGGKDIFDQIQILDAKGNPVHDPWLRDELWSADGKMLIIYIHPGRIKWGVILRELLGPVLIPDSEYTLRISGDMLDDRGQRLGKDWTKQFKTTAEDRVLVNLKAWNIFAPQANGKQPLTVALPKMIDHKSLNRFLTILGPDGKEVAGKGVVGTLEKSWAFHPAQPWQAAKYMLVVDGELEDTCGNTPLRPFDLDLKSAKPPVQNLKKTFHPK